MSHVLKHLTMGSLKVASECGNVGAGKIKPLAAKFAF